MFSLELTLSDYVNLEHKYSLYGVVNHEGSLVRGHYTADIKFND